MVFTALGGARIGWVNASWPFARITVDADSLTLSGAIGRYQFAPDQVVALEKYGFIPVLASGVRIRHTRADYPPRMVFWCLGSPDRLLERIRETGFRACAPAADEIRWRGLPVRLSVLVVLLALWCAFILFADWPPRRPDAAGLLVIAPIALAFAMASALRRSARVQAMVLRDGHAIDEIKPAVTLFQILFGVLLVAFVVNYLFERFAP